MPRPDMRLYRCESRGAAAIVEDAACSFSLSPHLLPERSFPSGRSPLELVTEACGTGAAALTALHTLLGWRTRLCQCRIQGPANRGRSDRGREKGKRIDLLGAPLLRRQRG